jgi:hypothetical protein
LSAAGHLYGSWGCDAAINWVKQLCAAIFGSGNILLLRGAITIHSDVSAKTVDELVHLVGERLLASNVIVSGESVQFLTICRFDCRLQLRA